MRAEIIELLDKVLLFCHTKDKESKGRSIYNLSYIYDKELKLDEIISWEEFIQHLRSANQEIDFPIFEEKGLTSKGGTSKGGTAELTSASDDFVVAGGFAEFYKKKEKHNNKRSFAFLKWLIPLIISLGILLVAILNYMK